MRAENDNENVPQFLTIQESSSSEEDNEMVEMLNDATSDNEDLLITHNTKRTFDYRLFNTVFLGISFMLIFSAFQTSCIVEQIVLNSAEHEANTTFSGSGYASLSIVYAVFSTCNWIAPSVVAVTGPKFAMFIGGIFYCLFILSFLKLMTWALYLTSVLVGLGAAIIWTGQGCFLTINSDVDTMGRNSGIFWAIFQCSFLFGNLYAYLTLRHDSHSSEVSISDEKRIQLYAGFSGACALGVLSFLILRSKPRPNEDINELNVHKLHSVAAPDTPLTALKKSLRIFLSGDMLLLSINFAYTGFELTFFSSVLGTCVGNTKNFGSTAAALVGIVGIAIGVGEILGGATFGLFGKRTLKYGRDPVVLLGYVIHLITFFIIFTFFPDDAPIIKASGLKTYFEPNKYVSVLCGFLIGFGDASFNTQIYSILGHLYSKESAPAFSLFKFVQSVAAAIAFAYSIKLLLKWQLLILVVSGTCGTLAFFTVEWTRCRSVPRVL